MKNLLSTFYIFLLLKILILDNNGVNSENTNVQNPYLRGVMKDSHFKIDKDTENEMNNITKGDDEEPPAEQKEGEQKEGEQGEQKEGEQKEGEQKEGEQKEGEQKEGKQKEGEQKEGEQKEGEQKEGEQKEGEQKEEPKKDMFSEYKDPNHETNTNESLKEITDIMDDDSDFDDASLFFGDEISSHFGMVDDD
ncbi:hypothetical protein YYE_03921 [Plasmodium vinckei vinckei]|uniref:Fam-c protein n=1 Tax=Plasmodium vinckei vinckei TaxID=54757 RepID=A0A081ICC5_PLAVN|nr:hypothetical protein YYE_03921 [Plasmodium vinckei vinckei]